MEMPDFSHFVRVTGVRDIQALEAYFGSFVVDVAHFDVIADDEINVISELGTDLDDPEAREWFVGLVHRILAKCDGGQAAIEVVTSEHPA